MVLSSSISFTEFDRSAAGDKATGFTAAGYTDFKPFSYEDNKRGYQGYNVELVYQLAERLNMSVKLSLADKSDVMQMLFSDEADILLNYETDLPYEEEGLIISIPTGKVDYAVYGRTRAKSIGNLYDHRVATVRDFPELGLSHELNPVSDYRELFTGIRDGKYDFGIAPVESAGAMLKEYGIHGIYQGTDVCHTYTCIALPKGSEDLRNRINIALRAMQKDGDLGALDSKWFKAHFESMGLSGIIRTYPWILFILLFAVFFSVFSFYLHLDEKKNFKRNESMTERIYQNMQVIDRQNLKMSAEYSGLERELKKAVTANTKKARFLANLSQELKSPVNSLSTYSEQALLNVEDPDITEDYLRSIERIVRNLTGKINKILEVSRIESGMLMIENVPGDLFSILDSVDHAVYDEAEKKNLKLLIRSSDISDSKVYCDRLRLNQALTNIVMNAIQYTEKGEVRVTLSELPCNRKGYGLYEFRVKDTGIGMDPGFIERLYEPFEKEGFPNTAVSGNGAMKSNSPRRGRNNRADMINDNGGLGLGLSISKGIIDAMGGTIDVITAPGRGTEFIVCFELRLQNKEVDPKAEARAKEGGDRVTFSGRRVLAVTQDKELYESFADLMRPYEAEPEWVKSGEDAINKVTGSPGRPYDLVITDFRLKDMDAHEEARKIRALSNPALSMTPIVVMTDDILEDDRKAAIEAGINGHLSKPVEAEEFIYVLKCFLKQDT
ncbi:MAG: transporter substrate-binding domain-containing protein [Lachnospiraceae bacterium]|nr:transporter substrate-binding domain-containing protein [Lachnospiraceae bacterium]